MFVISYSLLFIIIIYISIQLYLYNVLLHDDYEDCLCVIYDDGDCLCVVVAPSGVACLEDIQTSRALLCSHGECAKLMANANTSPRRRNMLS